MTGLSTVIVGPGRVGLTLARALLASGDSVRLLGRADRHAADGLPAVESQWADALGHADLLLITVPDDALAKTAHGIAALDALPRGVVVLHSSGLHDHTVLAPLAAKGAVTGSWHPLQSIPIPGDATTLSGVPAVLDGDPEAVAAGRELARRLGMAPIVDLPAAGKVQYHAAAVFASNYLVVLTAIAERLARNAGAGDASAELFLPIMRQTLANAAAKTPGSALTGPIRRGDVGTVAAHLAALDTEDRAAYVVLGREALRLAEAEGLDAEQVDRLNRLLQR